MIRSGHCVIPLAVVLAVTALTPERARAADPAHLVTMQPGTSPAIAPVLVDTAGDPPLSQAAMAALLRDKIRYVFVIFNENHSFDNEYGTFPGVDGLYSDGQAPRDPAATPGFTQTLQDVNGAPQTFTPFRIGPAENGTVTDSVDHSHKGLARKLDVVDGVPRMDQFAQDEYDKYARPGNTQGQAQGLQFARLVMAHIDCDTIPFLWSLADRFTIFDRIFATEDTPSTPNAIAMIAGQAGESQWVKHGAEPPTLPMAGTINGKAYTGTGTPQTVPLVNDPNPFWGSQYDTTSVGRQPTSPSESYAPGNVAVNMLFATVPLTAMGSAAQATTAKDRDPQRDLTDIGRDIPFIAAGDRPPLAWGWYQNGYDLEPSDKGGIATHSNYVAHHQGPQYFGYLANNPDEQANLHGEGDLFHDIATKSLPKAGGVFYVRGGFNNIRGVLTPIQNPRFPATGGLTPQDIATITKTKAGDDDHPGYADRQISEAMNAEVINAIASDPDLWAESAIVITYDESDGFYDHVPPRILSYGPDKLPLSRGIRVPLLLISPYARAHAVSHAEGDHNAVIETINAVFGLPALSQLPDEADALVKGNSDSFNALAPAGFHQSFLGPRDTNSPITDSLLSGFDPKRLSGVEPPLPASYAMTPADALWSLPHYGGKGCEAIGMVPEDQRQNRVNAAPEHFNTLPVTLPAYN